MTDGTDYRKISTRDLEVEAARSDLTPEELQLVVDELTRRITEDLLQDKRIPSGEPDANLGTDLGAEPAPAEPAPTPTPSRAATAPPRRPTTPPPVTPRQAAPAPQAEHQPRTPARRTPTPPTAPVPPSLATPSNVQRRRSPWRGILAGLLLLSVMGGATAAYAQLTADNGTDTSDDEFDDEIGEEIDDEIDTSGDELDDEPPIEEEFTGLSGSESLIWVVGDVTYTAEIETDGAYGTAQVSYLTPDGCDCRIEEDLELTYSDGDWFYVGSDPRWADTGQSAGDEYVADSFRIVDLGGGEYGIDAVCDSQGCYPT